MSKGKGIGEAIQDSLLLIVKHFNIHIKSPSP